MLKLNQQTVRNMIDRGEMGAVRVGQRRVRVRQSQLDAFLAAGEMTHEPGGQPRPASTRTLGEESGKQQMRCRPPSTRRIGMPLTRRCPPWRTLLAGYSPRPGCTRPAAHRVRPRSSIRVRAVPLSRDRIEAGPTRLGSTGPEAVGVGRSGVVRASTCLRAGRVHGWARVRSPVSPLATGPERSECCSCGLGGGQAPRRYRSVLARSTSVCRSPGFRRMRRVGAVAEASWSGSARRLWRSSRWCTRTPAAREAPYARDPRAPARAAQRWPRRVPQCGPRPLRSARGRPGTVSVTGSAGGALHQRRAVVPADNRELAPPAPGAANGAAPSGAHDGAARARHPMVCLR